MSDLENVIEDAVNDAAADDIQTDETTEVETGSTEETTEVEAPGVEGDKTEEVSTGVEPIVKAGNEDEPAAPAGPEDEFAKKFGLASKSVTGRENRIPYSRVKKIVEKNEKDITAKVTKDVEAKWQPKVTEFETKLKAQDTRLAEVAEFEKILENDPKTFLERLSQVPAYKPFFDYVDSLAGGKASPEGKQAPSGAPVEGDPRPLPNKQLADGSKVYDLEGLDALMAWQARQVEKKVSADLEAKVAKRYEPIENEWKHKEYLASIQPVIDKQIADARTWPHFTENEAEIVKILQSDKNITLEGAYRQAMTSIVMPKLTTDHNKIRAQVMAELKKAPSSTSVAAGKTVPIAQKEGPRSLEDIIAAEIAKISA